MDNEDLSGAHHLFDGVARHGVEEEDEEGRQQHDDQDFDDHPLVVVPQDVANGLQGIQKPYKRGIRAAAKTRKVLNQIQ